MENGTFFENVNENIDLIQKSGGHTYGTDAYLLYCFLSDFKGRALELGAGSGIISLLCASRGNFESIDALEVQKDMAELAKQNVINNHLDNIINIENRDLREWKKQYNVVFSNPPYIKENAGIHNPDMSKNISRREIFGTIDDFCKCASDNLSEGGAFCVVYREERLCDLLMSMRKYGIEPKRIINVYPDINHKPCMVLCEGRKRGGEGSLFVTPPFILSCGNEQTEDCKFVYSNGAFNDKFRKP